MSSQMSLQIAPCSSYSSCQQSADRLLQATVMHCTCLSTVSGHKGAVSSLVGAAGYLYTASDGSDILAWGRRDLLPCGRFGCGPAQGSVKALVVDGDRIFSAHGDHKIRVWRRASTRADPGHKLVGTLPTFTDRFISSVWDDSYVEVRQDHRKLWIQHADTVCALALGTRHQLLYSGSWDKTVKVWRLSDLKCVESIDAHNDAVSALVVSADGFLYTGCADGTVNVWRKQLNVKRHDRMATLKGHKPAVNALALSADGELLFSAGSDCAIVVWRKHRGEQHISELCSRLQGCHPLPILCLSTTGSLLLSGSADQTVRVWRINHHSRNGVIDTGHQLSCMAILKGHNGSVQSISVSANVDDGLVGEEYLVYSGSADKSVKVWRVSSRKARIEDDQQPRVAGETNAIGKASCLQRNSDGSFSGFLAAIWRTLKWLEATRHVKRLPAPC